MNEERTRITGEAGFEVSLNRNGYYMVELPHHCCEVEVAGNSTSKSVVVEEMEQFIAEATEALEVLKALP